MQPKFDRRRDGLTDPLKANVDPRHLIGCAAA